MGKIIQETMEARQKREYKRLTTLLNPEQSAQLKIADGLIKSAAFMRVVIEDLEDEVRKNGATDLFEQGDYSYTREAPAVKSHIAIMKNYMKTIEQLVKMVPVSAPERDSLIDFLTQRSNE